MQILHRSYLAMLTMAFGIIYLLPINVNAGDTQYWNEFVFEHDLSDKMGLDIGLEQQFVDNISEFALYNITIEPSYKISDKVSYGLGYRYEREKDNGIWATENRYWAYHTIKWKFNQSGIKLKSRAEYRDLENNNFWRFRSKLKFYRKMQIDSSTFTPFFSVEPFYDFDENKWNQIRTAGGISFDIKEYAEVSLYYLNMAKRRDGHWNDTDVLGTEIVFPF